MKMTPTPDFASSRMTTNMSSVSDGVRTAVGSSRIRSRVWWDKAFRTSTRWSSPTLSSEVTSVGSTSRPNCSESRLTSASMAAVSSWPVLVISRPRKTLAATVREPTSLKCWNTMPIPSAAACCGVVIDTSLPS